MSAQGVADKVAEIVKSQKYEFVMCNFAPPDMVRFVYKPSTNLEVLQLSTRLATQVSTTPLSKPLLPPMPPSGQSTKLAKKQAMSSSSLPITVTRNR